MTDQTSPVSDRDALVKEISAAMSAGKDSGGYETLFDMLAHIALKVVEARGLAPRPAASAEEVCSVLFNTTHEEPWDEASPECRSIYREEVSALLQKFDVRPKASVSVSSTDQKGHCWCGLHATLRHKCDRCMKRGNFADSSPIGDGK
jgi:hypothetical protein